MTIIGKGTWRRPVLPSVRALGMALKAVLAAVTVESIIQITQFANALVPTCAELALERRLETQGPSSMACHALLNWGPAW